MEELRKLLDEVILDIQQEKLEIMALLALCLYQNTTPSASKADFDLRSLNKKILPHVSIDAR
jgi:hypothetical protein